MASQEQRRPLYPEITQTDANPNPYPNPYPNLHSSSSTSNLYPTIDMKDLVENLFPDQYGVVPPTAPPAPVEEELIRLPGAILNLIDQNYSVELACGDLSVIRLRQGDNVLAVLVRVSDQIQWPLARDEASVKLDDSHYFFSLHYPSEDHDSSDDDSDDKKKNVNDSNNMLNYGLTVMGRGQEKLLKEFDEILRVYSLFSEQKVSEKLNGVAMAKEISPEDLKDGKKKEMVEEKCVGYWTTLAPNVEDYSGSAAKFIAAGSGQLIRGILWCGDVTVDRLKWGNEVMRSRITTRSDSKINPNTLKRIRRAKKTTKMTEKVATGVLSGVVKVSGILTSSVANSKLGKKFFGLLPGEIILASLDGFSKVCDAVEVAGKNVMSTSFTVTNDLVSHRYGDEAAEATNEGLGAAGHAIGTAWAAFKLRKALNPKSVLKPTTLAKSVVKSAAADMKTKVSK